MDRKESSGSALLYMAIICRPSRVEAAVADDHPALGHGAGLRTPLLAAEGHRARRAVRDSAPY